MERNAGKVCVFQQIYADFDGFHRIFKLFSSSLEGLSLDHLREVDFKDLLQV